MITFGSLFAGIGGFDLGFERAGMVCRWQVEIDPYCQKVLAKHWPNVGQWDDVRTFPPNPAEDWSVDVICGGFPCQDISHAGNRAGLNGTRSGLWFEFLRIIRSLRPRVVVVENVAALLDCGMGRILSDMADGGFAGEWAVLSACAFGAPHTRDRLFAIFYADGCIMRASGASKNQETPTIVPKRRVGEAGSMAGWWANESEPCSVVYGVSGVVGEIRPYGNAVVPQIAEYIGRRIVDILES